jgi:hypothetical protein
VKTILEGVKTNIFLCASARKRSVGLSVSSCAFHRRLAFTPLPIIGMFFSVPVGALFGSLFGLQDEQELGNVHKNLLAKAAASVTGGKK